MAKALDVARYLIHLAAPRTDEDVDCLCHLRLQKLLYYVQGWHLAARGRPLFAGRIEAWTHGPVVKEVYPVFGNFGWAALPPEQGEEPAALNSSEKAFIRGVWEEYKRYSATALRDMTHREPPWQNARQGLAPDARSDAEITQGALKAYFARRLKDRLARCDPRIDLSTWEASAEDVCAGRVRTTEEVRFPGTDIRTIP